MRFLPHAAVAAALLLSAGLVGQQVPPFELGTVDPVPGLSPATLGVATVEQIHLEQDPSLPLGLWRAAVTVTGLPAARGGAGGHDVLSGTYDPILDIFTPDLDAAAFNTPGNEFGLTFSTDCRFACCDDLTSGGVKLGKRASTSQPFAGVTSVTGLPSQPYFDPALVGYQGRDHLATVFGPDIALWPVDVSNAAVTGGPFIVIAASGPGRFTNSPTPFCDSNGEVIGFWYYEYSGFDNDLYFACDLQWQTAETPVLDQPGWQNNAGLAGGRFLYANANGGYHVAAIDTNWWTGGRAPIGGTMEVRAFAPPTASNETLTSWALLSTSFLSSPVAVPPFNGLLGVNLTGPAVVVPLGNHDNRTGEAKTALRVPNRMALRGGEIPAQVLTANQTQGTLTLGNDAKLTID